MKHNGTLVIREENINNFKNLIEVLGDIYVIKNAGLTLPKLEKSGDIYVNKNASLILPKLVEVLGYIEINENVSLTLPKLEKSGNILVNKNASLILPKLEKSDHIYVSENGSLTSPKLEIKNNKAKIDNKNYDIVYYDNIMFFIENSKTSKGIIIYSGILSINYHKSNIIKEIGYLATKNEFSAHGKTLKKTISDLQFKIVSDKLKNTPINENTLITVEKYRMITGACEFGCRNFMKNNNIDFITDDNDNDIATKEITVKELIPLLEKDNSYGLAKIKTLITF